MEFLIALAALTALKGAHLILRRATNGPSFREFNTSRNE